MSRPQGTRRPTEAGRVGRLLARLARRGAVFLVGVALLLFGWNVWRSLRGPRTAPDDPWEGNSLEWVTTSPPPHHNFHQIPQIISGRPAFDLRTGAVRVAPSGEGPYDYRRGQP
jgi:heme/copper-type cytochrome/quinol oxidase subunit 1